MMANDSPGSSGSHPPQTQAPRPRQILIPIILIATSAIIAGLGLSKLGQKAQGPHTNRPEAKEGSTLPSFALKTIDGKEFRISDLKAKVVLINFWATWCGSCMVEMPSIVQLRDDFYSQGFEVVAVNLDENPATAAPDAIRKLGMTFPTVTDPESQLAEFFDVHAIPFTAVVAGNGRVLMAKAGERDWNAPQFREQLSAWLKSN